MSQWAQSKYTPGQFLGSTDVRVLSQKELATGNQAWARKNQLIDTQPVNSGMGMHLLKKMGWLPGEGLGKEKNGNLTPLLLELKLDKRGLEANEEVIDSLLSSPPLGKGQFKLILLRAGLATEEGRTDAKRPKRRPAGSRQRSAAHGQLVREASRVAAGRAVGEAKMGRTELHSRHGAGTGAC
jgi:G-patch domain